MEFSIKIEIHKAQNGYVLQDRDRTYLAKDEAELMQTIKERLAAEEENQIPF